jgi:cation transport ATPase
MKKAISILILLLTVFTVNAQQKKNKNAKYEIPVAGNCDQCKKRIEKAAYATKGVKSADYHLDDNTLHVVLNEQKTDVLTLKKNIAKVGHDTDEVKATDEDYNNLHHCCKYERKKVE